MMDVAICLFGLFVAGSNKSVPLTNVHYGVDVKSFASHITIDQTYKNTGPTDIECVYGFPMNDKASVVGFTVNIDNRTLTSQFKKKAEAFKDYTNAIANNNGAYLLDQSERSDDTFVLSVGRLPPGKECTVSISYVGTLESVNETRMRLTIPTALSPRYNPKPNVPIIGVVAPETYESTVPYYATLSGHIQAIEAIENVSSSTHPLAITIVGPKEATLEFKEKQQPLDRDLVIEFDLKKNLQLDVEVEETSPGKYTAMLSFIPQFKQNASTNSELIFLVDCSGSMIGENGIGDAKRAMQIALRGIPFGSYFNIYIFGSDFKSLFSQSELYSEESFTRAKSYVDFLSADLGGTEILKPLTKIFSAPVQPGFTRQLFVLTDGEVSNTDEVVALVHANAVNTRLFSFGIGDSPSRSLVNGIAAAGNGKAEFIKRGQDLESVIGRHLTRALQPAANNVSVTFHGVKNLQQVPLALPPVFKGDKQIVYALFELDKADGLGGDEDDLYVELQTDQIKQKLPLVIPNGKSSNKSVLSKLVARELIKELEASKPIQSTYSGSLQSRPTTSENDNLLQERITEISLKYGVLSKYVSLIAVETRDNGTKSNGSNPLELKEIPIQAAARGPGSLASGLGGYYGGGGSSGGGQQNTMYMMPLMMNMINQQLQPGSNAGRNQQSAGRGGSSSGAAAQAAQGNDCLKDPSALSCVLNLQKWDGSWTLTEELTRACANGKSVAEFKAAISGGGGVDDGVLATVLASTFVQEKYAGQVDTWSAIVNKALVFLGKQASTASISALKASVVGLIKTK